MKKNEFFYVIITWLVRLIYKKHMSNPERNLLAQALVEDVLEYGKTVYLVHYETNFRNEFYHCFTTEEKAMEFIKKMVFKWFKISYNHTADINYVIDPNKNSNSNTIKVTITNTMTSDDADYYFTLAKIMVDAD